MAMPRSESVLISEVGPRDGLQSVARAMMTASKLRWIDALPDGFDGGTAHG